MIRGTLMFLTGNSPAAAALREAFIFIVIPMLNPDGVIQGNYRTSLIGCDLNRKYSVATKAYFLIRRFIPLFIVIECFVGKYLNTTIALFSAITMDIAESIVIRRKNIFMYGNNEPEMEEKYLKFPYLLSKICDFFSFSECTFGVQKSKASTARIALWKIVNTPAVYTIEASFYGASIGSLHDKHFDTSDYQLMGSRLCEAMIGFFDLQSTLKEPIGFLPMCVVGDYTEAVNYYKEKHNAKNKEDNTNRIITGQGTAEDDGSDSNPSEYGIDQEEFKQMQELLIGHAEKKELKTEVHSVKVNKSNLNNRPPIKCGVVHRGQVSFNIAPSPAKPMNKMKSVIIHKVRKTKSSKTGRVNAGEFTEMEDKEMQTDGDPRAVMKEVKELTLKVPDSIREAYQMTKNLIGKPNEAYPIEKKRPAPVQRSVDVMPRNIKVYQNERYLSEILMGSDKNARISTLAVQEFCRNPSKKILPLKGLSFNKRSMQYVSSGNNIFSLANMLDPRKSVKPKQY
jgi:hypothetical protein